MRREDIILETSLEGLLEAYENHCRRNGLRESSVQPYRKPSLRFLAAEGYTQRDCSCVVPLFKRSQPMPPVYSETEIRRIETVVDRHGSHGKRDCAALLLATRLGIRGGDIATLTFSELDFKREAICLTQQKTAVPW